MHCPNQKSNIFSQPKITLVLDFSTESWNHTYNFLLKNILVVLVNSLKKLGSGLRNNTNKFNKTTPTKPNKFFISQNLVTFRGSILSKCDYKPRKFQ